MRRFGVRIPAESQHNETGPEGPVFSFQPERSLLQLEGGMKKPGTTAGSAGFIVLVETERIRDHEIIPLLQSPSARHRNEKTGQVLPKDNSHFC